MLQQTLKMSVFGILIVFAACSKKTSTASSTTQPQPQPKSENRPNNRPNNQRGERPTFTKLLEKMDANKDGRLSKSEIEGPLANDFSKIDTNGDGLISEDEFKNAPKPQRREGKQ